jgi:glycosyltransferase involved in cell wall biosynthesis
MVSECMINTEERLDDPLHDDIITSLVSERTINRDAMRAFYTQSVASHQIERACHVLNVLESRFPNDREVISLNIALCLQCNDYDGAMRRIEWLVATCKPDNGIIDAALAVREKAKPYTNCKDSISNVKISLCMIIKDEISRLGACLNAVKPLVDEIIVVDTGSRDRSKDVARIFGAKVFEYQWRNDFSAARNFSLDQATGDWILILDADEIIAAKDHDTIRGMLNQKGHKKVAYYIVTRNYTNLTNTIGWYANDGLYKEYEAGSGWFPTRKVRLFPRSEAVRFCFPVHERVDPDIISMGMPMADCPVTVHHYGHLNEEKNQQKARLYFQLGYDKLEQFGDNLEAIRELAIQAGQLEMCAKAIELWQNFIRIKPDYAEAHVNLAGIYWQLGHYEKALSSAKSAMEIDCSLKEARYNVAISLMFLKKVTESIGLLKQLLADHPNYLAARFMLAAAFCFAGDVNQCAQQLSACYSALPKETLSMAVQNLLKKLKEENRKAYVQRLEQALVLISDRG